jgi:hypothetical protein
MSVLMAPQQFGAHQALIWLLRFGDSQKQLIPDEVFARVTLFQA